MSIDLTGPAKALMNNEAFTDALAKTQQSYLNAAMACPLNDDEGRRLNLSAARIVATIATHIAALATAVPWDMPEPNKTACLKKIEDRYATVKAARGAGSNKAPCRCGIPSGRAP